MTPEAIQQIRTSHAEVASRPRQLASRFYEELFSAAPNLRRLFPGDLTLLQGHFEAALALSPSCALAYLLGSVVLVFAGDPDRGIEWGERALRLSPFDPMRYGMLFAISLGQLARGEDEAAAETAHKTFQANPYWSTAHFILAATHAKLGRLDAAKAALPVLVARYYWGENAAMLAAIGAFLGHCFPVWLNFKGGKGVAVMIGSLLALSWPVGLIFCAVWLVIAFAQKMSSLAALTAAATAPIFAFVVNNEWLAGTAAVMALLLFFQHRENIRRLMAGTEPKIGSGKKAQ